jgi:cysteinyl-tRNA synthetase
MGYPGWHLECSAMSMKYLGESFDIHGGGLENQFPHHEDEIAQAEAATGKPFVKYWLHNNMVTVNGQKMGKSLGNFITLKDAFQKWDPMVLRLFILQSHYRSPLDFSDEALGAAKEGYEKLLRTFDRLTKVLVPPIRDDALATGHAMEATSLATQRFAEAMDDDFNTARALAVVFDLANEANRLLDGQKGFSKGGIHSCMCKLAGEVLGFSDFADLGHDQWTALRAKQHPFSKPGKDATNDLVQLSIEMRAAARAAKNFAQADAIRKRLDELGIALEDAPEGTTWRFK